jgi:hypothetical protein
LRQAIENHLANRRMLFVIDDVWTANDVRAFQFRSEGCAVVYTSRRKTGFEECDVTVRDVELLTPDEADDLFRQHANLAPATPLSQSADKILRHCNRHALAIVIAGSMLAAYPDQGELILERFDKTVVDDIVASVPDYRRSAAFPHQETSIFQVIKVSFDFLDEPEQGLMKQLAIFPEDTAIPVAAIEILARANGLDPLKCDRFLSRLDDAALLTRHRDLAKPRESSVTLHDLQRDFVSFLNKSPSADHRALVEGIKTRFCGRFFADGDAPGGDYFRRFMVHHMIGAGMREELFELLVDPDWIAHRLRAKDQVFDLIADYDRALGEA